MRVFISYSTADRSLVSMIADSLSQHAEVCYWDQDKEIGQGNWPQIYNWIDTSDMVLAVITGNTVSRAMSVGNEIGRAKAKGKMIIPLVGDEVSSSDLGCLKDVTYQRIEKKNVTSALDAIVNVIGKLKQKTEMQLLIISILAIVAIFWLASKK